MTFSNTLTELRRALPVLLFGGLSVMAGTAAVVGSFDVESDGLEAQGMDVALFQGLPQGSQGASSKSGTTGQDASSSGEGTAFGELFSQGMEAAKETEREGVARRGHVRAIASTRIKTEPDGARTPAVQAESDGQSSTSKSPASEASAAVDQLASRVLVDPSQVVAGVAMEGAPEGQRSRQSRAEKEGEESQADVKPAPPQEPAKNPKDVESSRVRGTAARSAAVVEPSGTAVARQQASRLSLARAEEILQSLGRLLGTGGRQFEGLDPEELLAAQGTLAQLTPAAQDALRQDVSTLLGSDRPPDFGQLSSSSLGRATAQALGSDRPPDFGQLSSSSLGRATAQALASDPSGTDLLFGEGAAESTASFASDGDAASAMRTALFRALRTSDARVDVMSQHQPAASLTREASLQGLPVGRSDALGAFPGLQGSADDLMSLDVAELQARMSRLGSGRTPDILPPSRHAEFTAESQGQPVTESTRGVVPQPAAKGGGDTPSPVRTNGVVLGEHAPSPSLASTEGRTDSIMPSPHSTMAGTFESGLPQSRIQRADAASPTAPQPSPEAKDRSQVARKPQSEPRLRPGSGMHARPEEREGAPPSRADRPVPGNQGVDRASRQERSSQPPRFSDAPEPTTREPRRMTWTSAQRASEANVIKAPDSRTELQGSPVREPLRSSDGPRARGFASADLGSQLHARLSAPTREEALRSLSRDPNGTDESHGVRGAVPVARNQGIRMVEAGTEDAPANRTTPTQRPVQARVPEHVEGRQVEWSAREHGDASKTVPVPTTVRRSADVDRGGRRQEQAEMKEGLRQARRERGAAHADVPRDASVGAAGGKRVVERVDTSEGSLVDVETSAPAQRLPGPGASSALRADASNSASAEARELDAPQRSMSAAVDVVRRVQAQIERMGSRLRGAKPESVHFIAKTSEGETVQVSLQVRKSRVQVSLDATGTGLLQGLEAVRGDLATRLESRGFVLDDFEVRDDRESRDNKDEKSRSGSDKGSDRRGEPRGQNSKERWQRKHGTQFDPDGIAG